MRLGIVGAGFMGELHARCAAGLADARVAAVVDADPARAAEVADAHGATVHPDVDRALAADAAEAWIVALPDRLHREATVRLLEAGHPVLVEKPMAHTLDDARAMAAAEARGGRLMVGHLLRFDPRYATAARAVADGGIGEPLHGASGRLARAALGERLAGTSSVLFYLGVHDVDALQWIAGRRITRVFARAVSRLMPSRGVASEDAILATVELSGGMVGQLHVGWTLPAGAQSGVYARTEIVGTDGVVEIDVRDSGLALFTAGAWSWPDALHWPTVNGRVTGDLHDEQRHFVDALLADRDFLVPTADALANVAVNDAILRSVASGRPEDVETP